MSMFRPLPLARLLPPLLLVGACASDTPPDEPSADHAAAPSVEPHAHHDAATPPPAHPAGPGQAPTLAGEEHGDREPHGHDPDDAAHADHEAGEHGHGEHAHGDAKHAEPAGTEVRVAKEMLRDLRITTTAAESRTGGDGVVLLGELHVNEEAYAEVGTPVAGRITRVFVGTSDEVKPGQRLAEIESVELGRARADYVVAAAREDLAQKTLARRQALHSEQAIAGRELQEAEAQAITAGAEARAARALLHALGVSAADLDAAAEVSSRFALRSPIAGVVIERRAALGRHVDPETPLFRVADLALAWAVVHAFERDALRVSIGSEARVSFPALPGRMFKGQVTLVAREVELASRTVPVRITVPNPEGLLRPGMSTSAWVPVGHAETEVVTVPAIALQRLEGGWVVFRPRDTGVFVAQSVGRGRDLAGEVEIVSGLRPGDLVVVDGAFLLKAEAEKAHSGGEHHHH